jgi:NAD(P)-dependent dehydrogenase (short-subunit alcohol dehydrogenase family)
VRTVPILGDIADPEAAAAMVKEAADRLGSIDVLVCNAAIRPHKALTDTSLEDWHRVIAVNLHSAFYLARAVVPVMKEHGRGSIIAIGGQSNLTGRPNTAAVTAAKTGLLGLVRALAAELGPFGIRANMVIPGFIDTERRYADWYPEFRQAPPGAPTQTRSPRQARPAGRHRRRLCVPRVRRVVLRHRRHDPSDGAGASSVGRVTSLVSNEENAHEPDVEALDGEGRPDRLDHLQPAGEAECRESGDVGGDARVRERAGQRRCHPRGRATGSR